MDPKPVSLITGASRGIGAATAIQLDQQGHQVILLARSEAALAEVAAQCQQAHYFSVDLTDETAVLAVFKKIQTQFGHIDHLINAAGIMQNSLLGMTRNSSLAQQWQLNVAATYQCCQLASKLMLRQKSGNIVNIGSIVGEQGAIGQSAYAASKAAVTGLTKALAKELGPQGVRVNAVAPGFIQTDLTADFATVARDNICQQISLRRLGEPADVAKVIGFLCSDAALYMTGQILAVDGGFSP